MSASRRCRTRSWPDPSHAQAAAPFRSMTQELLSRLESAVGAGAFLTARDDIAPFLEDHRHLYQGRALAVAVPRNVDEVSRILAFCNENRIGVVPHGGNTSYCGGATPDESGEQLVLSLKRLTAIREVDALNYSLTAEAGCVL